MRTAARSLHLLAALGAATLGAAVTGCQGEIGAAPIFIALDSDFAAFQSWTRIPLGDELLAGHPPGPRFGYLKQRAPAGSRAYPVGAMIVKTVESGAPEEWEVFGMVKRGGNFNRDGALDWEYFLLRLTPAGVPVIVSRGTRPTDPSDGGAAGAYSAIAGIIGCNLCHATRTSAETDHILSPLLAPGAP